MNETIKNIILFFGGLALMALCGCMSDDPEKSRHLDIGGVWTNPKTGTLIAGSIEVQSAPEGVESAMVKYEDDTSLFSDEKNHKINILQFRPVGHERCALHLHGVHRNRACDRQCFHQQC